MEIGHMSLKDIERSGFVYVMTNPSMPGLVKVGMSSRNPALRVKDDDLTSTGVPTPYQVQYSALFDDMRQAEILAHQKLLQFHYKKEFFKTDVATAIYAIESVGIPFIKHFSLPEAQKKSAELAELSRRQKIEEERRQRQKINNNLKRADELYSKAFYMHEEKSKREEAIELYSEVIHLNPEHAYAYINRGNLIFYKKDVKTWFHGLKYYAKEALKDYEKFVELRPDRPEGYKATAIAYEALSEHKMAIEYYQKACDLGDEGSCVRINQIKTATRRFIRDCIPFGDLLWNKPIK
jgi:tetratricopeptide (TPR) repeat protein